MRQPHYLLFEHTAGGLAEHAAPVAAEWIRQGHEALVMATPDAMSAVREAHAGLPVRFGVFGLAAIDWPRVDALFNVIPGEPGPAFRDVRGRCDIPRVTINHGLTDKQTTFPADFIGNGVGYANTLFACGPAMFKGSWQRYVRKWPEIEHSLRILPIGAPKTDVLFDNTFQRDEVLRSLGLDPDRPAVLYAPTYQPEASLERSGVDIVEALAAMSVSVIVRLHHLSMTPSWRERMAGLAAQHTNLRVVETSSNPLFVAADALVGDVSGACFEYILQDKPVVFYDVPAFFDAHGRDGVGFWGRKAGIVVSNPAELHQALAAELADPKRRSAERRALIGQLVYHAGGAAKRAVHALIEMIEGRMDYPTWGPRQCLRQDALLQAYLRERLERCAIETSSVALFGAGRHTVRLLDFMGRASAAGHRMPRIACILDDRAPDCSADTRGIPVLSPNAPDLPAFNAIILSTDYHQARFDARCREVFGNDLPRIDLYAPFPWHRPAPSSE